MQPAAYTTSLKNFFSRKDVSVICFILAITVKLLLVFYYQQIDDDKLFQAMAGKNLAEGHGLTIKQVHAGNLSKDIYDPFVGWPPGYSILVAIIYTFVKNVDICCSIIDVICIILYFILLRKLLRQLEFPDYLINLLTLFNGFAITSYIMHSSPTDFLTLVIVAYNCYLSIELFRQKKPVWQVVLLGFFNILPAWFRYMYIPVTFIIPAFLLWNGWLKKDRKILLSGAYIMVLAFLGIITLLSIQVPFSKPVSYIAPLTEKGIFWSNLLFLSPVLYSAFMDMEFLTVQLSHLTGLSFTTCARIFQWTNIVPFLFLLASLFYSSFKRKWLATNNWQLFTTIGTLISICTLLVLASLSLTHSPYYPPPSTTFWSYIAEDRYFIFVQFFIVILATKWLFMDGNATFNFKKWVRSLFLFAFSAGILHGTYFVIKNVTFGKRDFGDMVVQRNMLHYIDNVIAENKKKNLDVVVAGLSSLTNRSVLMGEKGLFELAELNTKDIYADKPTKLILIIKNPHQSSFHWPIFRKEDQKPDTTIGPYHFFSYYINSNTILQD
jgi:hypothetical protein